MSVSENSTDTQAKSPSENDAPSAEAALRASITSAVFAALPAGGTAIKTMAAPESESLPRRAALYALDNMRALVGEGQTAISEERLYELLRHGRHDASITPLLSHLYRNIKQIGHAVGTRKSQTHVAAAGFAMPITFKVTVYAIDALDLIEAICAGAKPTN
ncbi:MAG: hypothetical protein KGS72_25045 [Cyanobacteria bacterium REEB67]|nr:hypothetical protein [Cyanobacteria bacterium REEB67]